VARGFLPQIKSESFFEFGRSGYTRRCFLDRAGHDGPIRGREILLGTLRLENATWRVTAGATEFGSAALPSDGILRGEGEGIVPRNNEAERSDVYTLILNV